MADKKGNQKSYAAPSPKALLRPAPLDQACKLIFCRRRKTAARNLLFPTDIDGEENLGVD
jgi:hypothetical protein